MSITVRHRRKILCVFPAYEPSFGTFEYAWPLRGMTRAFMPPQGMLVIASYLPKEWEVRFVDENMRRTRADEFRWADAVFISGMHVQRQQIIDINRRAHHYGKFTALGGPSVSSCPDYYPEIDYLHIGELGDATDQLIARLDEDISRPPSQVRAITGERVPLDEFPVPAYHMAKLERYFIGSVQFSSGCPYRCEFCDIPALYGRNPRLKTPEQVVGELDAMLEAGAFGAIYFVDDNFIGNRKAARELLPHIVEWQKRNGFPVEFACEATLNIASQPEILALMREAYFTTVFCGIESPELNALRAMSKDHNAKTPILGAIETLNSYGLEVVAGIILGLDTDTPETPSNLIDFIRQANIPMLTINLLQALPKTPLHERLTVEGRVDDDPERESNVIFRRPYEEVLAGWRRCIGMAYEPQELYRRFAHNIANTYPNRIEPPASPQRASWRNIGRGLRMMGNIMLHVGLMSDYRDIFWATAKPLMRTGRVHDVIHVGLVGHHLISFTRDALKGQHNASFYSAKLRQSEAAAAV